MLFLKLSVPGHKIFTQKRRGIMCVLVVKRFGGMGSITIFAPWGPKKLQRSWPIPIGAPVINTILSLNFFVENIDPISRPNTRVAAIQLSLKPGLCDDHPDSGVFKFI